MEKFTLPNESHSKKNSTITLIINYAYSTENQRFDDLQIKSQSSGNYTLSLNEVIDELKTRGHNFTNTAISYLDKDLNSYIYCGIYPFLGSVTVPHSQTVEIKVRQIIKKDNMMRMELKEENVEENDDNENIFINVKSKRSKERKIGYIIEKVFLWRKLYNGFQDEDGNLIKLTLEEAAEKVGISKKSLDDYLIQLR